MNTKRLRFSLLAILLCFPIIQSPADELSIEIDATNLPRRLLESTVRIPVTKKIRSGKNKETVALWYPKWVPGSHGPGGPIGNVGGLRVTDGQGNKLAWSRSVGKFHRIEVSVPAATKEIQVQMRYICNQPTTSSAGLDSFGSQLLGFISNNTVFTYPEVINIDKDRVKYSFKLPDGWKAASALPGINQQKLQDNEAVSIRRFIDCPVMCGLNHKPYVLTKEHDGKISPHRLHIFSEAESVLNLPEQMVDRMRKMVHQSAKLFDSQPFEQFDILLATSDILGRNGLEHSSSSFNILGQRSFQDPKKLKGWDRLLVPHEYIHAWCGKYRRPAGMVTKDFHTDKKTELLWVYEGLTQYLGELVEARSGLMSPDEFRHRVATEVRAAMHQQGRDWRSLADTAACSDILRKGSDSWPRLRRSQDYYMEGMLFWLEADAIIRDKSEGKKSLDDFCHAFFKYEPGGTHPKPFDRDEIVQTLGKTVEFDWDGLIRRRIEALVDRYDLSFVQRLGYTVQFSNAKPSIPATTFRRVGGVDLLDSIGAVIETSGVVKDLLLGTPADKAGLGPGMKIIAVNGHKFSQNRMQDAISMSANTGTIVLMVESGDSFVNKTIDYAGGPRFMQLVRNEKHTDVLAEIVKPR